MRRLPDSARAGRISAACLALALAGCASASFSQGVYRDRYTTYRIGSLGTGWQPVHVSDNDLAFHRARMGTISVNSTCTEYDDVPTSALLNHLLFETTQREALLEEVVPIDGRGARHVVMHAELDGVPLEFEVFIVKKDGCVFDLSHIRGQPSDPAARATFARFVQQFAVLEVRGDD